MSKIISFSISDRYLDKIRSLYPDLTENLAAKQFLIDQLDESLYTSLNNNLDDKLRTIEKNLENRSDTTKKWISEWILGFHSQIKDIDREMKDRSIAIEHQIEKIKIRLNESLDTSLDDSLDDNPDSNLYESYSEIFIDKPDENLDTKLDTNLDTKLDTNLDTNLDNGLDKEPVTLEEILLQKKMIREEWLTLKEILSQRRKTWPKSIEGLRKKAIREGWPSREIENRKEYQIPVAK
jgi:hypothetical protein